MQESGQLSGRLGMPFHLDCPPLERAQFVLGGQADSSPA